MKYNLTKVFEYASTKDECDAKTKYNRIKRIMEYLKNYYMEDENGEYLHEYMEINKQVLNNRYKGYKIDFETVIFLTCLYNNDSLIFWNKKIKDKYFTEKEFDEWFEKIMEDVTKFETEWQGKEEWGVIATKIVSIYYRFGLQKNSVCRLEKDLLELCMKILSLPEEYKKEILEKEISSRLKYINNSVDKTLKKLSIDEKILYNIDLDFNRKKYLNKNSESIEKLKKMKIIKNC